MTLADPIDRRLILMARVMVVLHRVLEKAAQKADLTVPQYRFLLALKRGPKRASDLASTSGVGRATASVLISSLEQKAYIERSPLAEDGRVSILKLTDAGLARYAQFEQQLALTLGDSLPKRDTDSLLDQMEILAHHIDSWNKRED